MAIAAGLCLLLCLIEGGEAMARTATAASSGWQAAAGTIGGAAAALLAGAAVVAVLTAAVPLRWRPVAGGTVALLAGLQWLVRAVLRLRGQVLVAQPGVAQKVLGGGGEAVIVTAALGAVVVPGGAPLVVGGAAGTAAVLVTAAAVQGLRTRGRVPGLPEKPAKTVLACCLTAAGGAGLARGGLPLTTWALCLGAVSAVTFAVVVIPGAPRTRPRAPASTGLRGFLSGDDAATWLGAAGFVLLRSVAPAAWLPGLLAPLTGAILCHATRRPFARRDPFRGTG